MITWFGLPYQYQQLWINAVGDFYKAVCCKSWIIIWINVFFKVWESRCKFSFSIFYFFHFMVKLIIRWEVKITLKRIRLCSYCIATVGAINTKAVNWSWRVSSSQIWAAIWIMFCPRSDQQYCCLNGQNMLLDFQNCCRFYACRYKISL